jgi:glutaredoxin
VTPRVTMYSRPECGLCDEARRVILALRDEVSFEFEEVSVEGRADLEREYGLRIPVVAVDGEDRFELHVDPADLRAALRDA